LQEAAMATGDESFTEDELREAFRISGLGLLGWDYQRAITTSNVALSLRTIVRGQRRIWEKQNGKPAPVQRALI